MQRDFKIVSLTGLLVASLIMVFWIGSLIFLLSIEIAQLTPLWIVPAILGRTFFQTGLFIVAHDAIHGAVIPGNGTSALANRRLNDWIGRIAVTLYALLSYRKLALSHWQKKERKEKKKTKKK